MGEIRENFCLSLCFVVFTVFTQLNNYGAAVEGGNTLPLGSSITRNQTIISKNGTFELGFFSPNGTNNWYIGIWYANLTEKTIVWVANRETPARNRSGVLKLSKEGDLVLFDAEGTSLWSTYVTKKSSQAVLLDSGNFVMLSDDNKSETVWQSFDYPADTLLPWMRFGGHQKLVSWKSSVDPAPGIFSYQVDPSGVKQLVLIWNSSVPYSASGTWDGKSFSQIPRTINEVFFFNVGVENSNSGFYVTYSYNGKGKKNVLTRYVLVKSGGLQAYGLFDDSKWSPIWSQPADPCSVYGLCGAYGTCNSNNLQFCTCVEGFTPKDKRAWDSRDSWSSGCVRQSPLNCDPKNGSTDEFLETSVTLPDADSSSSYPATTKKDCQKACLLNCSCTAFAFNPPSGPCQIWSGDLLSMRNSLPSKDNSSVFIRIAASALSKTEKSSSFKVITTIVVGALAVASGVFSIFMWRRHRQRQWVRSMVRVADCSNSFLRMFSYMELKIATRNFKSKLGSGGFGTVYKGHLIDGTLVAVKKMEGSRQDEKQFRAEISSLGNIQYANLVRLRGFCVEGSGRFLIYDFMPNGSLNSLLFSSKSKGKQKVLNWKTRFEIALGTARGLLYLHEECRDCIIHCDVKPENILLDHNFSPKLADFGLAKLVGRNFSRVLTTTRGTRGYLAPEWISGLPITPKVDVYSFGMMLLEIISGRRNLDLNVQESSKYYFPPWAATQIYNGDTMNIVEEGIIEERDIEEVRRASIVGLLCIGSDERLRPSMGQVVLMLEGKRQPKISQIGCYALMDKKEDRSNTGSSSHS